MKGKSTDSVLVRDILEWNVPEGGIAVLLKDRSTDRNFTWATDDHTAMKVFSLPHHKLLGKYAAACVETYRKYRREKSVFQHRHYSHTIWEDIFYQRRTCGMSTFLQHHGKCKQQWR